PGFAAIFGDLNQAVIGSNVKDSVFLGRFGERDDIAVERSALVLGDSVWPPNLAHYRQLVAIDLASQVGRNRLPVITAVVAAKQNVGGEIDATMIVRGDEDWRIPVIA